MTECAHNFCSNANYIVEEIDHHSFDEESEWKIEEYADSVIFDCGRFVLNNAPNLDLAYLTADLDVTQISL